MDLKSTIQNINKVIERDSKFSSYKFALLRGVIEIVQERSPYIVLNESYAEIPLGLLIEKWIVYYYPLLEGKLIIGQSHGKNLAFEKEMFELIKFYKQNGGLSALFNDLRRHKIPSGCEKLFKKAAGKIAQTIVKQPMRYIGNSLKKGDYSIFKHVSSKNAIWKGDTDIKFLLNNFDVFTFPLDYYYAFEIFGSFLNGYESVLLKWAVFSENVSGKKIKADYAIGKMLESPVTERDAEHSKKLYANLLSENGNVLCVWTGRQIKKFDVDHVLPFATWRNNDLWNLIPSSPETNNKKRDKIPSPLQLEKSKDLILQYWSILDETNSIRFRRELEISLLGYEPNHNWQDAAFKKLCDICSNLITERGFEEWNA